MQQDAIGVPTDEGAARVVEIRRQANWMRQRAIQMIFEARQGHPGGDMSATDILATLYFGVMRYDPAQPLDPQRDRFVMSKGHCTGALYTALAAAGFFPEAELSTYLQPGSRLNGHPNRRYLPGVETNTGPLGHGLPVAVGIAVAGQIDAAAFRTFALTGDGELQEGSMWEAAMFAGHRKLANLTAIVDRNRLQQGAGTEETNALEPLADKWRAFGWDVAEIDGHDHAALLAVLDAPPVPRDKPLCIIANTIKGFGISFMRDQASWHHGVPSEEQYAQALEELALSEEEV
ncbi:transketolase [Sphingomonas sp. ZT3P38]|uniref:transketolase n=1 Tax=Parasphingomonas zepuensis TaxID=3096161 RepID=UPI002FCAD39A